MDATRVGDEREEGSVDVCCSTRVNRYDVNCVAARSLFVLFY